MGVGDWLASQIALRPGARIDSVSPEEVVGVVPTSQGPTEFVFEQYSNRQASLRVHVMREPAGSAEKLVTFHAELDQNRATLFDRRIDSIGGELWYGRDMAISDQLPLAQKEVGKTLSDLAYELPQMRSEVLRSALGLGLSAKE